MDFDLTAKEINSHKRYDKIKPKSTVSGRVSESPIDGVPSDVETVKWAFSNINS
jgi:hypothetical protein